MAPYKYTQSQTHSVWVFSWKFKVVVWVILHLVKCDMLVSVLLLPLVTSFLMGLHILPCTLHAYPKSLFFSWCERERPSYTLVQNNKWNCGFE